MTQTVKKLVEQSDFIQSKGSYYGICKTEVRTEMKTLQCLMKHKKTQSLF